MIAPFWVNTVTVETYTGAGAYGPVYAAPVTISCFVDDSAKLTRHQAGDEVVSGTTIYAPPETATILTVQSRVTVNGRVARVITANSMDGDAFGLPSHVVATLT